MKYYFILNLIGFCFLAISCGDNYVEQQKSHDIVMEIHDDVMPKTATIQRLIRDLKKVIQEENSPLDKDARKKIMTVIQQLENADEGMMSWMRNYKKPKKDMPKEEALNYLAKEKEQLSKVRTMMLESIKAGENLLSQIKQ